jgi:hypothetical protein
MNWLCGVWLSIRHYRHRRTNSGIISAEDDSSLHRNTAKPWPCRAAKAGLNVAKDSNTQRVRAIEELRCERCRGRRSPAYHCRHWQDPIRHPAVGICSRRRTGCASYKESVQRVGRIEQLGELPDSGSTCGPARKVEQVESSAILLSR